MTATDHRPPTNLTDDAGPTDRGSRRPRLPRGRRTFAAVIVAVLLLLLAGFAGWQAILVQTGRPPYSARLPPPSPLG